MIAIMIDAGVDTIVMIVITTDVMIIIIVIDTGTIIDTTHTIIDIDR
jgi:hypothetical protein